jgi:hypothetical protein
MQPRGERFYGEGNMTSYPLCSQAECQGELISPFGTCIKHLSSNEETYAAQLRRGEGSLAIAFTEVEADFVHEWVERVSITSDDGVKILPVDLRLEHSIVDGRLKFANIRFARGVNLTGLRVQNIQIDGGSIEGRLVLDYAVVQNEISLLGYTQVSDRPYLQLHDLSMFGCEAQHFGLLRSVVNGTFEARKLKMKTGTMLRDAKIHGRSFFGEAQLCDPGQYVNISAEFADEVDFTKCKFPGDARFGREPDLPPSIFHGETKFDGATFGSKSSGGALLMTDCLFKSSTSFKDAEVFGGISLSGTKFERPADFTNVTVTSAPFADAAAGPHYPRVQFAMHRTQFESSVTLNVKVEGKASIEDFTYSSAAPKFSVFASDEVLLKRVSLESFNVLELSSGKLVTIDQVQLHGGGEIKVTGPQLTLSNFTCARPVTASSTVNEKADGSRTALATLAGTNCDNLILSEFDYRDTKFLGATNLDLLRVDGEFALLTTGRCYARRAVLVEEALFRATNYWYRLAGLAKSEDYSPPEPRRLAAVYRALRKGREDQKDEPGSADFYYGEMEMRRRASSLLSFERVILTLYWLISGYGLRAWRTLTLLALVVFGSAFLLWFTPLRVGDKQPPDYWSAVLFSGQSGLSLAGLPVYYSPTAQWVQLALRIAVPGLIALAVLAIRARVKR